MVKSTVLNEDQKAAFDTLKKFIDSGADTFVLKGYAGTGKTFLMQHFAKWLQEKKKPFSLLASTGRAATVLRGKTGFEAKTVHAELYRFSRVDGDDEETPDDAPDENFGQMTLRFSRRGLDSETKIYIVDEASMLSSEVSEDETTVTFGSGQLIPEFFDAIGSNKVIFVGDPCQLPPVGQEFSPALDLDWLASSKRTAITVSLNKIERTDPDNEILLLAGSIRNMTEWEEPPQWPKLPARGLNNIYLYKTEKELFDAYLTRYKEVGINGTLAIARANETVGHINRAVRRDLYGNLDLPLQVNDTLLVVQNNHGVPLTNGDFVSVTSIGEPVFQAGLNFISITVKAQTSELEFNLLLSLDVLYGKYSNLTQDQQRRLMIDFSRRMRSKKIKPNSHDYKDEMMSDPYINCLKAKYGYGVTCHKAQGGEWDDVYLFLNKKMYGMQKLELFRWWYTAVTRAKKTLHITDGWWIE